MKRNLFWNVMLIALALAQGCSSSDSTDTGGSGETGGFSALSDNFETVSGSLVPEVGNGEDANLNSPSFLVSYSDDDFADFYSDYQSYLSEIFGSADEEPAVVTKIRVSMRNFVNDHIETLAMIDPDMECQASELAEEEGITVNEYNGGDSVASAILGDKSNGEEGDRHFDCWLEIPGDGDAGDGTYLYGKDAEGRVYILAHDASVDYVNEENPEERGDSKTLVQVTYGVYRETEADGEKEVEIDLQYAQASIYSGIDNDIQADEDNIIFKSRSRITGRVTLDEDNTILESVGHFSVIKYDQGVNDETVYTLYSQVQGRGSFLSGGNFLLTYNSVSNDTSQTDGPQTFCVTQNESATLSEADSTECTGFESAHSYGTLDIPVVPEIDAAFEENALFTTDELIADDGSDFVVPDYAEE